MLYLIGSVFLDVPSFASGHIAKANGIEIWDAPIQRSHVDHLWLRGSDLAHGGALNSAIPGSQSLQWKDWDMC